VRTAADRQRRLRSGAAFLWLTLAALRGTAVLDVAAHALAQLFAALRSRGLEKVFQAATASSASE
jgi:hypothetical protein